MPFRGYTTAEFQVILDYLEYEEEQIRLGIWQQRRTTPRVRLPLNHVWRQDTTVDRFWVSGIRQHYRMTYEQAVADPECLFPVDVPGYNSVWVYYEIFLDDVRYKVPILLRGFMYVSAIERAMVLRENNILPALPALVNALNLVFTWVLALTTARQYFHRDGSEREDSTSRNDQARDLSTHCFHGSVPNYSPTYTMESYKQALENSVGMYVLD